MVKVKEEVEAEQHAMALNLVKEFDQWRRNVISSSDFGDIITAQRQRALELEKFVNKPKV